MKSNEAGLRDLDSVLSTSDRFKKTANRLLVDFYEQWKSAFSRDKISFDQGKVSRISDTCYRLVTSGVSVDTLAKFTITVSADLSLKSYTDKCYTISMYIRPNRFNKFRTDYFNPVLLVSNFHQFFEDIMNIPVKLDDNLCGLTLLFDHKSKILSANISMTILKNDTAIRADHLIYHHSDNNVLRSNRLVHTGVTNYRNFKFLWDYTAIKTIMDETVFLDAYKAYAEDIDRYHALIAMEKI